MRWDLSDIFSSPEAWEESLDEIKDLTGKMESMSGEIVSTASGLWEALQTNDSLSIKLARAYSYARLGFDTAMSDSDAKGRYERIDALASATSDRLAFWEPELLQMTPEMFNSFQEEIPELSVYAHTMEKLFRKKEHILSPGLEEVLAKMSTLGNSFKKVFDDITVNDLEFPEIKDEKGNPLIANEANYGKCLNSYQRDFRKKYFKALLGTYGSHQNSITSTYYGSIKHDVFLAQTRKYKSSREMALEGNFIPPQVYDKLIKTVRKNVNILQDYIAMRKKALGLERIHFYDLFVPLTKDANVTYSFDQARELVLDALSVLGADYIETAKRAFDERWVDIYPQQGKRSGAYAMGIYDVHPYMLLNYGETLDDIFTLAHELGHVMHSYYSNKNQPFTNSHYTIFTAEVASTVNENILYRYLLSRQKTQLEKAHLLNMHLNSMRSTLFRQAFFADFEMQVHDLVENEKPITPQILRSMYRELYGFYHGKDFVIDEELTYEWLRIPHFYRSFYVYQYATGISAAISIAGKILEGARVNGKPALDGYRDFLRSGGSDYSINLLQKAGVDMSSPQAVLDALQDFEATRRELENICF